MQAGRFPIAPALLAIERYVFTEQNSGIILLVATIVALVWANSPWKDSYYWMLRLPLGITLDGLALFQDLQQWVNDGLMTIFFFVVGMEVKREVSHGELASPRRALLPIAAAVGGMVVPAVLYSLVNLGGSGASGWGIPIATDIAFALGTLSLVGPGIPAQLRIFLLTLAVVDDIGAILVIAIFYSEAPSLLALGLAALLLLALYALRRLGVQLVRVYVFLGALFWLAIYESGVHATITGVILGLLTPSRPPVEDEEFRAAAVPLFRQYEQAVTSADLGQATAALGQLETLIALTEAPVDRLERLFHPWASYFVLPVFALFNAGVTFSTGLIAVAVASPITIGVAVGLIAGKPVGVLSGSWLALRLRWASLPASVSRFNLAGVGLLAGIGFTVSLFINDLAFVDPALVDQGKIGIFAGSVVSGTFGYLFLRLFARPPR